MCVALKKKELSLLYICLYLVPLGEAVSNTWRLKNLSSKLHLDLVSHFSLTLIDVQCLARRSNVLNLSLSLSLQVCTAKMNLSDEVDLEDYVSRPDKISAAEVSLFILQALDSIAFFFHYLFGFV